MLPPLEVLRNNGWFKGVNQWGIVIDGYFNLLSSLKSLNFKNAIKYSSKIVTEVSKIARNEDRWICIPLMTVTTELRKLVMIYIQSSDYDEDVKSQEKQKRQQYGADFQLSLDEELANVLQKAIQGLFKTYIKFEKFDAAKNMCKVLLHSPNLPPLSSVPKSQSVTYKYFLAMVECMNFEHLENAAQLLNNALIDCENSPKNGETFKNQLSILLFLMPINFLMYCQLPSPTLWERYPSLAITFRKIFEAVKQGNLKQFDEEVADIQILLLKRHVYSFYIRMRPFVELRLFNKTAHLYIGEKKHIIPLEQFTRAEGYSSGRIFTQEETESRLASLIFSRKIKGYISHGNKVIVLSKKDPFPKQVVPIK
ncbi:hypothetical protein HII12_005111 [Brettanomyces bruxellensis]|uniref:PCI domain-containing protein n=1 Tax=Dekkera bruxellensis TaxID=5007 RepID=A0A8H6EQC4_DEKBR|nr:hypothetical protein HII12_005111 [Brettanomyces bruxellensis]